HSCGPPTALESQPGESLASSAEVETPCDFHLYLYTSCLPPDATFAQFQFLVRGRPFLTSNGVAQTSALEVSPCPESAEEMPQTAKNGGPRYPCSTMQASGGRKSRITRLPPAAFPQRINHARKALSTVFPVQLDGSFRAERVSLLNGLDDAQMFTDRQSELIE